MKNFYHRAWAEINLDVLKNNIEIIREYSGNRDIIAIVKANAYGHGDAECALAMNHIGVKHFAVSNLWEAQNLSSAGVEGDILLFGYCDIPLIFENLDKNYIFTVGSVPYARELSEAAVKAGLKVPVHIKFDTGMCRVGITTAEEADQILALPGLDARDTRTSPLRTPSKRKMLSSPRNSTKSSRTSAMQGSFPCIPRTAAAYCSTRISTATLSAQA